MSSPLGWGAPLEVYSARDSNYESSPKTEKKQRLKGSTNQEAPKKLIRRKKRETRPAQKRPAKDRNDLRQSIQRELKKEALQEPVAQQEERDQASMEQLEEQISLLEDRLSETAERQALKNEAEKEEKRFAYDPVPGHRIDTLTKRLRLIDLILVNHGRAYDYRTLTTPELKDLLRGLEASQKKSNKKAPQSGKTKAQDQAASRSQNQTSS